ncbi:YaaC family protein [Bacillus solitudinis]|uniref:YaaC family protein n=1 Tax=Bacillus solitudinis TaxID=2014074 RepID=UPI000C238A67|nr:YaaC family protein [Bacillus solitudinis]
MKEAFLKPLVPFYSASYTRSFLTECYDFQKIEQPKAKGYQTSYSFLYHLHHGQLYFEQASNAPIEIKPILLFYGLVQFMKACILTRDPLYPESTQVLAHGVTSRKRKKTAYRFLDDEVKIQRTGLYSHFLDKMFHMKQIDGEKYRMDCLLKQIPELHDLFLLIQKTDVSIKGESRNNSIVFSSQILNSHHMTPKRFEQHISQYKPLWNLNQVSVTCSEAKDKLTVQFNQHFTSSFLPPFLISAEKDYFLLNKKENYYLLPEITVHYLLLYNLSMISRYETEWWGELIHTIDGNDLPFILHFLDVTQQKIPLFLYSLLKI